MSMQCSLRRVSIRTVLFSLSALLNACASGPTAERNAGDPLVAVKVRVEPVEGLIERAHSHYDQAELGTRVRFVVEEAPWVTFDLFAYRVGVTDDLEGGLRSLLDQYRADMDAAVEQGTYAG